MSGIGQIVPKVQEFVTALGSSPLPTDTRFIRFARPFAIYVGIIALSVMGVMAVYFRDTITAGVVVAGIGTVLQQFGAQRSGDRRAGIAADTENKKTITAAAGAQQ